MKQLVCCISCNANIITSNRSFEALLYGARRGRPLDSFLEYALSHLSDASEGDAWASHHASYLPNLLHLTATVTAGIITCHLS